jgi:hypothetical protein
MAVLAWPPYSGKIIKASFTMILKLLFMKSGA